MNQNEFHDRIFEKQDTLVKGEYDSCVFNGLDLSNGSLAGFVFIDCHFNNCNWSLANITQTSFLGVHFKGCKLLGLRFETCNPFGFTVTFEDCQLNHASFHKMKMQHVAFRHTQLQEADFTDADCSSAVFEDCNLERAVFDGTVLEKADFRTAYNYSIDLDANRVKKAKFNLAGLPGLLDKYNLDIEV